MLAHTGLILNITLRKTSLFSANGKTSVQNFHTIIILIVFYAAVDGFQQTFKLKNATKKATDVPETAIPETTT